MTDASCSVVPSPTHRFPLKLREFSTGVGVSYLDTPMDAISIEIEGSISMEVAGYVELQIGPTVVATWRRNSSTSSVFAVCSAAGSSCTMTNATIT